MAQLKAELVDEVALEGIGAPAQLFLMPGNQGSCSNFLWLESMGIFMSKIFMTMRRGPDAKGMKRLVLDFLWALNLPMAYAFSYLRSEKRDLFCLTLTDTRGRIIWQKGNKSNNPFYCSHMTESLLAVADLNGDGKDEVVAICGPGRLAIFDLETGAKMKEVELPGDNYTTVRIARTGSSSQDFTILAANSDAGYPPHTYSNPVLLLDSGLNILRQYDLPGGAGHSPQVFDADGDGFEEFLVGYALIDHDGEIVWVAEGFEDSSLVDAKRMHADHIVIIRGHAPGQWRAAVAGSDRLYMFDSKGKKLWARFGEHPQYLFSGRLNPDNTDLHLFLLNCRFSMEMIDLNGNSVWKGRLPGNWPLGRPNAVRGDNLFHMGIPGTLWRNPLEDGKDVIIYNEAGFPYGIDGMGNRVLEFPCPPASVQPEFSIPRNHRPDDFGYGFRSAVADINGDGQQEVIIYDRRFAWIYKIIS